MSRKALAPCALGVLAALASPAWAQGLYAGVAGGASRTSHDLVDNRESTITLATDVHTDFDDRGNAWKVFAGYQANGWLGVEATYADLGSHHLATTVVGGDPPLPGAISIHRGISGFGADLVLGAPFADRFRVFGKVGAFRARVEASAELAGNVVFVPGDPGERSRTTTRTETVTHFGVGASWEAAPRLSVRLEWERFQDVGKPFEVGGSGTTGQADTDLYTVGVAYRFR